MLLYVEVGVQELCVYASDRERVLCSICKPAGDTTLVSVRLNGFLPSVICKSGQS